MEKRRSIARQIQQQINIQKARQRPWRGRWESPFIEQINLGTGDTGGPDNSLLRELLCACRMVSNISGFHLPHARSTLSSCDDPKHLQIWPRVSEQLIPLRM